MKKEIRLDKMTAHQNLKVGTIILKNFIGGIAWGIGSIIGASIMLSLVVWFATKINFIPIIGDIVAQVTEYVTLYSDLR